MAIERKPSRRPVVLEPGEMPQERSGSVLVVEDDPAIRGVMQLPEPPHVVMITAFASIETAIRAVKLGAYDYIAKPFEIEELLLVADKAFGERALRHKVARLQREVEE